MDHYSNTPELPTMDPPVEEEGVYNYYNCTEGPIYGLLSTLAPVLLTLAHESYSNLLWFRHRTVDTTDTVALAAKDIASTGGGFLAHTYSSQQYTDHTTSWYAWCHTTISAIISMNWSLGAYLWQTCSGLGLVLVFTSILPGRLHGWTGRALRLPVLGMTYMMISAELVLYTLTRFAIRALEGFFSSKKHRAWRKNMEEAKTYEEWYGIAKRLDCSQGREKWQNTVEDDTAYRYSWPLIQELLSDLKSSRNNNDIMMALAVLQQCTRKNVGGIMSDDLFSFTNCGEPKRLVSEFIDEVEKTLMWVTEEVRTKYPTPTLTSIDLPESCTVDQNETLELKRQIKSEVEDEHSNMILHVISSATFGILGSKPADEKAENRNDGESTKSDCSDPEPTDAVIFDLKNAMEEDYERNLLMRDKVKTFIKRARAAYGRTALCLSGGAMMGNYHFGAVKALIENDLLPPIISGTSAGSVVGAMICTRTTEELMRDLRPEVLAPNMSVFASSWGERLVRWYRHGSMFDQDDWYKRIKFFTCGDLTFEEAYKKTGMIFCVTLSATSKKAPPVLINYITAPNVVIASAVVASAAVPGFLDDVKLKVKDENGVVREQSKRGEAYRDGSIDCDIPIIGLAEMLNCRFFLAAQANPHIVPFFYNSKGDVGRPSRWSSGVRDASWRGGFLLSALEMYLKTDMRSKFRFLHDLEVAYGFSSTLMIQDFKGSTTIVPQVCFRDYLLLFQDQSIDDMNRYFQGGSVAAYQHIALMKLHYKIPRSLDECLARLEYDEAPNKPPRRRLSQSSSNMSSSWNTGKNSLFRMLTDVSDGVISDDEHEKGGFDCVDCAFGTKS